MSKMVYTKRRYFKEKPAAAAAATKIGDTALPT
jgi:hypothetical protein